MAAFLPLKIGGWAYGEILTSGQMNQLNTDFPYALNLRDGANYTPSGTVGIQTPTTKTVTLNNCSMPSAADGGGLNIAGATGLVVTGNASVSGTVTAAASAITTLTGSMTLSGKIFPLSTGRMLPRVLAYVADVDGAAGPDDCEIVLVANGIFTANRSLTIVDSSLGYEAIEVEMLDPTYSLTVKHPTTLTTLLVMKNAAGFANWARFRAIGIGSYALVAKNVL